jgi:hypothetical protein
MTETDSKEVVSREEKASELADRLAAAAEQPGICDLMETMERLNATMTVVSAYNQIQAWTCSTIATNASS